MPFSHDDKVRAQLYVRPLPERGHFHVKAASDDTDWYQVVFDPKTGTTSCDCAAAMFSRACWHRRCVRAYLSELIGKDLK